MILTQALIPYLLLPSTALFVASQLTKADPDDAHAFEPSENQGAAPNTSELAKPKVLIVGAGIGGLMLAFLLKKGGVPFLVLERAHEVKPLGSGLTMGSNVKPLFEQLGIYKEFQAIGKQGDHVKLLNEDLTPYIVVDFTARQKMCAADEYIVARPDLYELLLRQIPKENILMGKKMVSFQQDTKGVTVQCADGTSYSGDILVGADGTYSSVRESLYKDLQAEGKLSKYDAKPLPFQCVCLLGQTETLDPEEFPQLKLPQTEFNSVLGNQKDYTRVTITTKRNTICWVNILFLDKRTSKTGEFFRNSEWGPQGVESMCEEVRDFTVPGGKDGQVLTMGDLIDRTPKDLISKVMLEEKVFDAWFSGRTVLLGDACHKLNPSGGAGALSAIHDAVALANWICSLQSTSLPTLARVFKEYHAERHPIAKRNLLNSQVLSALGGKSFMSMVFRALFKRMPKWIWNRIFLTTMAKARPQLSFLPLVKDTGSVRPLYQPSLHKTLAIHQRQQLHRLTKL
ncbi:hypothetical protein MVEG_08163 [Podila verticillata NRRL 6337]|nr:hypothetical protein MVEG_08163 [Podila verticillata NRRL 6337]